MWVADSEKLGRQLENSAEELAAQLVAATVSPDKAFAVAHAMAKFTAIIMPALQVLVHGKVNGCLNCV
jgi:hypothetical protein